MIEQIEHTIQQMVRRLVEGYQPQRIILFGSIAYGDPDEDSDIDLLIVKETIEAPLERRVHVRQLVSDPVGKEHTIMTESMTVTLPGELVADVEPLLQHADIDLDTFVYRVVQAYVTALRQRRLQEQLAQDYDELATMYDELAAELSDEVWLPLENEALLHFEKGPIP